MDGLIDMNGKEVNQLDADYVTSTLTIPMMTLSLDFQGQI